MFSTYDCAVKGYRQKEDPWNAIIAGFLTGGSLAIRSGPKSMFGSAVGTGILLGVFEGESIKHDPDQADASGVGVLMGRMFAQPVPPVPRKFDFCYKHGQSDNDSSRSRPSPNTSISLEFPSHVLVAVNHPSACILGSPARYFHSSRLIHLAANRAEQRRRKSSVPKTNHWSGFV